MVVLIISISVTMRWHSDMNVRPGRHTGNGPAKCQKGNAIRVQEIYQCLAFHAIRMQRNIHGVVMIQAPLVVNRTLSKDRNRQGPLECLLKETFNLARLRKQPGSREI